MQKSHIKYLEKYLTEYTSSDGIISNNDDSETYTDPKPNYEDGYEQISDPDKFVDEERSNNVASLEYDVAYVLKKVRETFLYVCSEMFYKSPDRDKSMVDFDTMEVEVNVPNRLCKATLIARSQFGAMTDDVIKQMIKVFTLTLKQKYKSTFDVEFGSSEIEFKDLTSNRDMVVVIIKLKNLSLEDINDNDGLIKPIETQEDIIK